MNKRCIASLFVLLAAGLYGCSKQKEKYTGIVLNQQINKPIEGVWVINYKDSTTTDSLGHFSLAANGHSGSIIFKMAGFNIDSAKTYINHSGEHKEELFDLGMVYLTPVSYEQHNITEINSSQVHDYNQDKKFYSRNIGESEYALIVPAGFVTAKYTDQIIPVKGSYYKYDIATGNPYVKITQLTLNKISCKLIAYTTPGENDTRILNFQLNSYDKNNKIIDALLLDSRFTFDIEYYSQYQIYGDGKIHISRFSINKYEQNEQGDLIGEKANPDTTILKEVFKLNEHGRFIEVKNSDSGEIINSKWVGSYYGAAHNKDNLVTSFKLVISAKGNCTLTYISDGEAAVSYENVKAIVDSKDKLKINFDLKSGAMGILYLNSEDGHYYFSGDPVYTINPGTEQLKAQKGN